MKVLVPLAQDCEEIEAVTVIDLLRRAGITTVSAGLDAKPVKASRGVMLMPDADLDSALESEYDMVVLPGGAGTKHLGNDARILSLVKSMAAGGRYVAAICAAPIVLAKAGILENRKATAFPGTLETMGFENAGVAVLRDGNIITSRGPGTAMDFALELIEILAGIEKRQEVEAGLMRA
ncbi:MAG: DJ-1/PfpI family protein [Burkholderiales bacterium]|nr:DJ-1/PfpI family protein [Burkholderiales bacterium]